MIRSAVSSYSTKPQPELRHNQTIVDANLQVPSRKTLPSGVRIQAAEHGVLMFELVSEVNGYMC